MNLKKKIVIKIFSGIVLILSIITLFLLIFKPILFDSGELLLNDPETKVFLFGRVILSGQYENCESVWLSYCQIYPIFTFIGLSVIIVGSL
ncbi:MAG: hypothetical protein ACTSSK_10730, partial [Candidatus Heimdallarchaeota archaeon]